MWDFSQRKKNACGAGSVIKQIIGRKREGGGGVHQEFLNTFLKQSRLYVKAFDESLSMKKVNAFWGLPIISFFSDGPDVSHGSEN